MDTKKKKREQSHYISLIIMIIIIFGFHHYTDDYLNTLSEKYILQIKKSLNKNSIINKIFFLIYEYISNEKIIIFLMLIIVYNFGNIYKILILFLNLQLTNLISSLLKILYRAPRPFWKLSSEQILSNTKEFVYQSGYGNPSSDILISISFYLTLHKIIQSNKNLKESKIIIKLIIRLLTIFMILFHMYMAWIYYSNSLSQILFSFFLAIAVYFFIFYVLNLYSNDYRQIKYLLDYPIYFQGMSFLGICFVYIFIFFVLKRISPIDDSYMKMLNILNNSPLISNKHFIQSLFFDAFINFSIFFANVGIISAMKFEYHKVFERNFNNWAQYNFEIEDEKEDDDQSIFSQISFNKVIQWNHTSLLHSILRLVFILILLFLSSLGFIFISWHDNIFLVIFVKLILTMNLIGFGTFYAYKQILKYLKVTNLTFFIMLRESI